VVQNYWGRYETAPNQIDGVRHFIGGFETYDLQGEFRGFKWVKLAVGARNVFDRNPPLYIPVANYFQLGYDPSIYDPRGRFVYGRVTFSFR
jgi:iron complex outermembrane receptor protein